MSPPDFIECYPNALDPLLCAAAIEQFELSGQIQRGATGGGVDAAMKDSWDIDISQRPDWAEVRTAIETAAFRCVVQYVMKYRYTLLAPIALKRKDALTGELQSLRAEDMDALSARELHSLLIHAFRPGGLNLQKYLAGIGGYPYWHCEHYPRLHDATPLSRVLLYSLYLNDTFEQGETEFYYQQRKIKPATGSLLIAPAFFTHTHRGNRPQGGDKYIATSWILFQEAEQMFGAASVLRHS